MLGADAAMKVKAVIAYCGPHQSLRQKKGVSQIVLDGCSDRAGRRSRGDHFAL